MESEVILIPRKERKETREETPKAACLEVGNYLSEYVKAAEKGMVRTNLNVPSFDDVYTRDDVDRMLDDSVRAMMDCHLGEGDPHGSIPVMESMVSGMVRNDGSTPFLAPQAGLAPRNDNHLTTKKFVTNLVRKHQDEGNPHGINDILGRYALADDVYTKDETLTRKEVAGILGVVLKADGSTPFTRPQSGMDPREGTHLTTKSYVDIAVAGVREQLARDMSAVRRQMGSLAKASEVYRKNETYDRNQANLAARKEASECVRDAIDGVKESISGVRRAIAVGKIPFERPQYGVDAVIDGQLATLGQVRKLISDTANDDGGNDCWITDGPLPYDVGSVKAGTELPRRMTLQRLCDLLFYGRDVDIGVTHVPMGNSAEIRVRIIGDIDDVEAVFIHQDDEFLEEVPLSAFEGNEYVTRSKAIVDDSHVVVDVQYRSGAVTSYDATIILRLPVFIGLLQEGKRPMDVTMADLERLAANDTDGTRNVLMDMMPDGSDLVFHYAFSGKDLYRPMVAMPTSYPGLKYMKCGRKRFYEGQFHKVAVAPFEVMGRKVTYKIYVFEQGLSHLDDDVKFVFRK